MVLIVHRIQLGFAKTGGMPFRGQKNIILRQLYQILC